ncbi:MAG TPA: hypothetical protein VM143_18570 [Acidimicrobiales bacterium]|nr:hypothetical protein [Acidimicrobiales bacterium]
MGVVVLIVLAAVWAAFLLPPILRARSEHRPSGSISDFRRQLHVLARSAPAGPVGPSTIPGRVVPIRPIQVAGPSAAVAPLRLGRSRQTIKRRRDIFVGLLVAMGASLVLGAVPMLRILWTIHLLVDVLFVAYVGALVYLRNLEAERELKVRFLPTAAASEPALLLRRTN